MTNTNDAGVGSLRQALLDANATPGPDTIRFQIGGAPPFTIAPVTALPAIYDPVTLDATSQPGYIDRPLIELRGAHAGPSASGLRIVSSSCVIRGFAINRFARDGIRIEAGTGNVIEGNYVGTDVSGTSALGNGWGGIAVLTASNIIGGAFAHQGNLVSGGLQSGLYLQGNGAIGNVVIGNRIGTDRTGTLRLPNANNGLVIAGGRANRIGGTAPGEGNIISGNTQSGVYLLSLAAENRLEANRIGLGADGLSIVSNVVDGITLVSARGNLIGGTQPAAANVISGNGGRGVLVTGADCTSNVIAGNRIGTDHSGRIAAGNRFAGVEFSAGQHNVVGGLAPGSGNLISANGASGITASDERASAVSILGNFVGTDLTGTMALGNTNNGVYLVGTGHQVGGSHPAARNVISGNHLHGILLPGVSARSNVIVGNFVGVDVTGTAALANLASGVALFGPANRVGGSVPADRNVIAANAQHGVLISGSGAGRTFVQGNFIGTDVTGTQPLGNGQAGVAIDDAPDTTIGGTGPTDGNLISANSNSGVYLNRGGATRTVIQGNRIGTDVSGARSLGNEYGGVYLYGAPANSIGGAAPGAGNLISGNTRDGISIGDPGAEGNVIAGNFIGTTADANGALGNQFHNIELLAGANRTQIGGPTPAWGNRIAHARSSGYDGIRVRAGSAANSLLGNSLFNNGGSAASGLGIDIGEDGVTTNDPCDSDVGANQLQNFPLFRALRTAQSVIVSGSLQSRPGRAYQLQFFANSARDPSAYGEGELWLGAAEVVTSADCTGNFMISLPQTLNAGLWLAATATDPDGNTSEFSAVVLLEELPTLMARADPLLGTTDFQWRDDSRAYGLERTASFTPPILWETVPDRPVSIAGTNHLPRSYRDPAEFFRLVLLETPAP